MDFLDFLNIVAILFVVCFIVSFIRVVGGGFVSLFTSKGISDPEEFNRRTRLRKRREREEREEREYRQKLHPLCHKETIKDFDY